MSNFKILEIFAMLVFMLGGAILIDGQTACSGDQIFNAKSCAGDELSAMEMRLVQLVNQCRTQNNLPPVPVSKSLAIVANRHLLDIVGNLKKTTHSWSNCPYELNDRKTWDCVSRAPERIGAGYDGQGYENLFRTFDGSADPEAALAAWKKSDLHNSLLINLSIWKDKKFDAFGVAFNGQYAALWFGSSSGSQTKSAVPQGLGVSYQEIIKNLSGLIALEKISSVAEQATWKGISKDKKVSLELTGTEDDITNAKVMLKINMAGAAQPPADKKQLIIKFIDNVFGESDQNPGWFDENLEKLNAGQGAYRNLIKDNKVIEITKDQQNNLVLIAKPYRKPAVREVF